MSRKATVVKKKPAAVASTSPVRNSPIPRPASPLTAKKVITHEQIAERAYCIAISGSGSDDLGNWLRAERELGGLR